jgi:hypothetical protein
MVLYVRFGAGIPRSERLLKGPQELGSTIICAEPVETTNIVPIFKWTTWSPLYPYLVFLLGIIILLVSL